MKKLLPAIVCLCAVTVYAQRKPLDHSVYDQWQSITERTISNDGKYVAYTINPQEGDDVLVIQAVNGSYKQEIARGYSAVVSNDNRFVICRIKPPFKDTRDARIKKKKPEDMPKDSLGMIDLVTGRVTKMARVKSFKMPDETGTWLAYLLEKALPETNRLLPVDSLTRINNLLTMADSLAHAADSLRNKANAAKEKGMGELQVKASRNTTTKTPDEPIEEGTDLVLTNLATGETRTFHQVSEYFFNRKGNALVLETTRKNNDPSQKASVIYFNLDQRTHHTILVGFNDAKGYQFDEAGNQLAFVAERDSSSKALQKFYRLYYYKTGADSAVVVADRKTKGIPANWTVSENSNISFSKNGARLFFGTAPILPAKDTSLPEFERVNVDIWHYKDDYIQPVQLKNLDNELKHNYLARADLVNNEVIQLATDKMRQVVSADALAAGIAALGISFVSDFLFEFQVFLRLIGGMFLCVIGYRIYRAEPAVKVPTISTNGLLGAYATTFFLTFSNPVTILSFVAIYAGWHVPTLHGDYLSAALLMTGVFIGSALWWVLLFTGLTLFRLNVSHSFLGWVHRVSGAVIVGFGIVVLLSLSPLRHALNITFF